MPKFEFEKDILNKTLDKNYDYSEEEINEKYERGETRIITEHGTIKLPLLPSEFDEKREKYILKPKYQRRITWDNKKRSKLIESFIMNIPVPPVFIYETEFNKYQVMDGLQRISAIIDFYDEKYPLTDLSEWKELNGMYYNNLPKKVKEGIDRRQLSVITLLKESTKDKYKEDAMKKMVFERLNTGGVTLEDQEIRNALYGGKFNDLCISLSSNTTFRKLWDITTAENMDEDIENYDDAEIYVKNKLYKRMYDVEIVLRYFAMRHIEHYSGRLSDFLDLCLMRGNLYSIENLEILSKNFIENLEKLDFLFGSKAFCQFKEKRGSWKWGTPQKMIYDPLMLAVDDVQYSKHLEKNKESNIKKLEVFYKENNSIFNGKKQGKLEIIERKKLFMTFLKKLGVQFNG